MRRFALATVIALLTLSASGLSAFVIPERCGTSEDAGRAHGDCAPTCVTCGCCAQAAEPVLLAMGLGQAARLASVNPAIPPLPEAAPADILHVPKARFA